MAIISIRRRAAVAASERERGWALLSLSLSLSQSLSLSLLAATVRRGSSYWRCLSRGGRVATRAWRAFFLSRSARARCLRVFFFFFASDSEAPSEKKRKKKEKLGRATRQSARAFTIGRDLRTSRTYEDGKSLRDRACASLRIYRFRENNALIFKCDASVVRLKMVLNVRRGNVVVSGWKLCRSLEAENIIEALMAKFFCECI